MRMQTAPFWIAAFAVGAAVFGLSLLVKNQYYFFAGYVVLQYVVLATAWNILGGYTGYVNFGTAAFFALGAYSTVVLYKLFPMPIPALILVGGAVSGVVGLGMGYLTLRLRGVFFSIATLALAVVVQTLITNWDYVGGSRGAYIIRPALVAITLSGALMGMAGAPLPYYVTYLDPASGFNLAYAVNSIAMPLIGGMTSWIGPIIGAVFLGTVQQVATVTISSALNLLIVGVLLVAFVIIAPNGIVGLAETWLRPRRRCWRERSSTCRTPASISAASPRSTPSASRSAPASASASSAPTARARARSSTASAARCATTAAASSSTAASWTGSPRMSAPGSAWRAASSCRGPSAASASPRTSASRCSTPSTRAPARICRRPRSTPAASSCCSWSGSPRRRSAGRAT